MGWWRSNARAEGVISIALKAVLLGGTLLALCFFPPDIGVLWLGGSVRWCGLDDSSAWVAGREKCKGERVPKPTPSPRVLKRAKHVRLRQGEDISAAKCVTVLKCGCSNEQSHHYVSVAQVMRRDKIGISKGRNKGEMEGGYI